jgi:hypothetical protein
VSRFQFVADHRHALEAKWLCEVIDVACSSFCAWLAAADTQAAKTSADDALAQRIRTVHTTTDRTCGAPRVNHKWVARVTRNVGIARYRRKRRVKTTVPDPAAQKVPDLLARDFTAAVPNTKYVGIRYHLPAAGYRRQLDI